jgi:hypothetical protein
VFFYPGVEGKNSQISKQKNGKVKEISSNVTRELLVKPRELGNLKKDFKTGIMEIKIFVCKCTTTTRLWD